MSSFIDTLGIASLGMPLDSYEQQNRLIALCREKRQPFFASMPVRSQFHCAVCGLRSTQIEIQFEDPRRASVDTTDTYLWSKPVGLFFQIDQSHLHQIVAHDAPAPPLLLELINGVGA
jgi:hypothetical protein